MSWVSRKGEGEGNRKGFGRSGRRGMRQGADLVEDNVSWWWEGRSSDKQLFGGGVVMVSQTFG
jgi:hypothetical protein